MYSKLNLAVGFFILMLGVMPLSARAATITVDTNADLTDGNSSGFCNLREAIENANDPNGVDQSGGDCESGDIGHDEVVFDDITNTIPIVINFNGPGDLDITDSVTVSGNGPAQTIIDGNSLFRLFDIVAGAGGVILSGLTMQHASADAGAAVRAFSDLTIENCLITDNEQTDAASGGGGISVGGIGTTLIIQNSTLSNHTSVAGSGGALYSAGLSSNVSIINSTVSGNNAGSNEDGGGIFHLGGTLTIKNSTITNNSAAMGGTGGGLFVAGGLVNISNTILALNTAFDSSDCSGTITSSTYNIISDTQGCTLDSAMGNLLHVDPLVGELTDNGGLMATHALLPGSPAIDQGSSVACADSDLNGIDQRGSPRCVDAKGLGNPNAIDIGAYEVQAHTVTKLEDVSGVLCAINDCSLRDALAVANIAKGTDAINFADSVAGTMNIDPNLGQLLVSDNVAIYGPGADVLNLDANKMNRILLLSGIANTAEISGLTFNQGGISGGNVGAISSTGNLFLRNCAVRNSVSGSNGAGITNAGSGNLVIENCTVSNNVAEAGAGGGIYQGSSGALTITNSTLSGNQAELGGGALYVGNGSVSLNNISMTGNVVQAGDGGGIYRTNGTINVRNSLIVGNSDLEMSVDAPDCYVTGILPAIQSLGYNLLGDVDIGDDDCNFNGPGDILDFIASGGSINGILDTTLRNNGGSTLTHALVASSPAIDAGDANGCSDAEDVTLATDQRGWTRPVGSACDIGAYEVGFCGDGIVDPGEECDDGNTDDGDGCNSGCEIEVASGEDGGEAGSGDGLGDDGNDDSSDLGAAEDSGINSGGGCSLMR